LRRVQACTPVLIRDELFLLFFPFVLFLLIVPVTLLLCLVVLVLIEVFSFLGLLLPLTGGHFILVVVH
jgi:hypothetical protein